MTEPVSTTAAAAGTAIGWAKIGSAIKTISTSPLTLAAIVSSVVLLMTMPRTKKQQFVALTSTFLSSIFGGAFVIEHYGLQGLSPLAVGGVYLLSGIPAWVLIRGLFAYTERDKTKGILDYIKEVRQAWKGDK